MLYVRDSYSFINNKGPFGLLRVATGGLKMQDLKMGDQKMKYLKMQDLKMKDQMSGHKNAGPEMRYRKLEDKQVFYLSTVTECKCP